MARKGSSRKAPRPSRVLLDSLEAHRARGVPFAAVADLVPWVDNPRDNAAAVPAVVDSLQRFGWTSPVLYRADGRMVEAGHTRLLAAHHLGLVEVPAIALDHDQRTAQLYALADNRLNELAPWTVDVGNLLTGFDAPDLAAAGFPDPGAWLAETFGRDPLPAAGNQERMTGVADVPTPEPPQVAVTRPGDVWSLGRHLVICGATGSSAVAAHLPSGVTTSLVTDPPYCSGGFQEASRASGSVGVRDEQIKVANDRLSTRGFQALIRSALEQIQPVDAHVFTDWRQWSALFDATEACGLSVRSMIVWAKPNAGLGRGWRPQHELILYASSRAPDLERNRGNVLLEERTQNLLHTTEKPVSVVAPLVDMAQGSVVVDCFAGSGTTLVAAEQLDRPCVAVELDPAYVDTIVERWERLTGGKATRKAGT